MRKGIMHYDDKDPLPDEYPVVQGFWYKQPDGRIDRAPGAGVVAELKMVWAVDAIYKADMDDIEKHFATLKNNRPNTGLIDA